MTSRAPRAPRPARALLVLLGLVLAGCGGSSDGDDPVSAPAGDVAAEHHTSAGPAGVLLRPRDLPDGYVAGHAHATAPTGDEPTPPSCRPLAQLLRGPGGHERGHPGGGPATRHGQHPAVTVAFARSHLGPTVTQTVVDVGGREPAAAAVRRIEAAATGCEEYVQSTSRIGAGTYAVAPLQTPAGAEPGSYVRLTAQGADFEGGGIRWDLWVHDCEGTLVAVTFRSAPGGDNADFWSAVSAAKDRMHAG